MTANLIEQKQDKKHENDPMETSKQLVDMIPIKKTSICLKNGALVDEV